MERIIWRGGFAFLKYGGVPPPYFRRKSPAFIMWNVGMEE